MVFWTLPWHFAFRDPHFETFVQETADVFLKQSNGYRVESLFNVYTILSNESIETFTKGANIQKLDSFWVFEMVGLF